MAQSDQLIKLKPGSNIAAVRADLNALRNSTYDMEMRRPNLIKVVEQALEIARVHFQPLKGTKAILYVESNIAVGFPGAQLLRSGKVVGSINLTLAQTQSLLQALIDQIL